MHKSITQTLEQLIVREIADKAIPGLSIALVEDQTVLWSKAFGFANVAKQVPATTDTVYWVGSITKLFTSVAVMRLVEQGALDLDVPVTRYLPDFHPKNPFNDEEITLRHLLAHRASLPREPPVGGYFDDSHPTLSAAVASLNQCELVYPLRARTKYSNAAIATLGLLLERTQNEPFQSYMRRTLLKPLGMTKSDVEPTATITRDLATTVIGTYHGRDFRAPIFFQRGMGPASNMYSTVTDLARFIHLLLAGGRGPHGPLIRPETLQQMWTPQFVKPGEKSGFGFGFYVTELDGRRRIGHGGTIYGFVTELAFLPDEKLGVIVSVSRHGVTAVTERIADFALRQLLAAREGRAPPVIEQTEPLREGDAARFAGRYRSGDKVLDLVERTGQLFSMLTRGGFRLSVRRLGDAFMVDDRLAFGPKFVAEEGRILAGEDVYEKIPTEKPKPAPEKWRGLFGEYGPDHNILYLLEKDGRLHIMIDWFFFYPLSEEAEDLYAFPSFGLYHGEKLLVVRDSEGRAIKVITTGAAFSRREPDRQSNGALRADGERPLDELQRITRAGEPPEEKGDFTPADLVDLTALVDTIRLDIRYATIHNHLAAKLYSSPRALLQRPIAKALVRVHQELQKEGYGLVIHDAYRPWHVTRLLWEATQDAYRPFFTDPTRGSPHNRGAAVDLTLFDRTTGQVVEMVSRVGELSDRAYPDYFGGTSLGRWHRDLLRRSMEAEGFTVSETKWWHFNHRSSHHYRLDNRSFEDLEGAAPPGKRAIP